MSCTSADDCSASADNQFVGHRVPVKNKLQLGTNELYLHFESAFLKGRDIEKAHEKYSLWNGDSSRLHVRKAQYKLGQFFPTTTAMSHSTSPVMAGIGVRDLVKTV
jgi:hypothetical protein